MSLKQTYIDSINADIAAANALKQEDFINDAKKKNEANKNKDINTYSTGMDSQIANAKNNYDKQITNANMSYAGEYERNAVQKLINERQIAEKNANLGLTDSGLNRTQQTAAQLSYANQKANIDLARRNTLDNLNLALTDAVTTLQNNKASGIREIENNWDNLSYEQGVNAYNNKLKYYNDRITSNNDALLKIEEEEMKAIKQQQDLEYNLKLAEIEKDKQDDQGNILLYNFTGGSKNDESGTLMLQYTGSDGKSYFVAAGKNPYTNSFNAKISKVVDGKCIIDEKWKAENKNNKDLTIRACAEYGVFSNGYQPKGVCYYDEDNVYRKAKLEKTGRMDYMNGKLQTVWKSQDDDIYWIWDGSTNQYCQYVD